MIGLFQFGIKKCQQFLPGIIGLNLAIAVRVYEILKVKSKYVAEGASETGVLS